MPEWEFYFHGRGCCISHKIDGAAIDVDFWDDSAEYFDTFFYRNYLESLRRPEPPEQRLRELHPSARAVTIAVNELIALRASETPPTNPAGLVELRRSFLDQRRPSPSVVCRSLDLVPSNSRLGRPPSRRARSRRWRNALRLRSRGSPALPSRRGRLPGGRCPQTVGLRLYGRFRRITAIDKSTEHAGQSAHQRPIGMVSRADTIRHGRLQNTAITKQDLAPEGAPSYP